MRGDTVLLSDTELRFIDDAEKQAEAEFDSDDDDDDGDGDDDAEDSITLDKLDQLESKPVRTSLSLRPQGCLHQGAVFLFCIACV